MNWLKKFGSLCLAVVLSVCLLAQVGSALADDKKVTSVEVETMPSKTVYVIGEEFSAEGGTLKVTYDDGTTEIVAMTDSGVKLSKPTMKTANTKNVTATVGKKRVVFKIEVVAGMCVVTFDLNYDGAPAAFTQEVSKGGTASEPAAPARDGYEFVAWYADADYTHTYDFAAPVTGDTIVHAFWKKVGADFVTVTFDLNYDGAPAAFTQEVSKGGTASEPAAPARDGYEFVAWYADADYTHTYDFAAPVTGDTIVHAFWKKVGADFVTVTFDYDYYGVLLNQYSYPVEVGAQVKQPVANPERTGYAFDKWVDENGSDFDFSQPIMADTTIKAAWNKTVSGQNTYVFEAEDTDLTGKIGPSYSGSAQEESMIIYNESVGASGNRMVGYLYASGISLEFYIASDMDVDDATIDVSITGEFVTMSYDGNDYQVIVNGEAKSYPRVTIEATQSSMPQCADLISIKGVHLNKGANLIQLMTNNTNEVDGTTFKAYAPIVDCVKVTTEAVLIWDENHNEPATGNYQK